MIEQSFILVAINVSKSCLASELLLHTTLAVHVSIATLTLEVYATSPGDHTHRSDTCPRCRLACKARFCIATYAGHDRGRNGVKGASCEHASHWLLMQGLTQVATGVLEAWPADRHCCTCTAVTVCKGLRSQMQGRCHLLPLDCTTLCHARAGRSQPTTISNLAAGVDPAPSGTHTDPDRMCRRDMWLVNESTAWSVVCQCNGLGTILFMDASSLWCSVW
jgi:hypothetical protein